MSRTALIVVDMINAYDHPDAERLVASVEEPLPTIEDLIDRSDLTIYVNDNFGHWRSNRDVLVKSAVEGEYGLPRDAVAHIHQDLADAALRMMELNMGVDISPARDRG